MCGQNSNSHRNWVVKPGCLLIFCCRIFILFAIWDPKSWFKAVCDQKSPIRCWYRTRITLNNRVMWTVSDLSMLVSIASRFPPGPLEAEWPIHEPVFASTRKYRQRTFMSPYQERHAHGEFCLSHCLRQRIFTDPIRKTYTARVLAFSS